MNIRNHEEDEDEAEDTESSPDPEDVGSKSSGAGNIVDKIGGGVSDGKVETVFKQQGQPQSSVR